MLTLLYTDTVTLHTRAKTGTSPDGNDVYSETDVTSSDWSVYPRGGSELVQGQDVLIVGITAACQRLVTVEAIDAVTVASGPYAGRYEVDGLPGFYVSPFTAEEATELHLTRVTG